LKYFIIHTALSVFAGAALMIAATSLWSLSIETWQGIIIGFLLAVVFVLAGFLSFYKGLRSGQKEFNLILFGSIFVRLMLAAIALILLIKFTSVDQQALLISMFVWYVILQIGELIGFHKINMRKV